jgi:hypothetical protein
MMLCLPALTARSFPMSEAANKPDSEEYAFRRACQWSMFTLDSRNPDWMYSTWICKLSIFICMDCFHIQVMLTRQVGLYVGIRHKLHFRVLFNWECTACRKKANILESRSLSSQHYRPLNWSPGFQPGLVVTYRVHSLSAPRPYVNSEWGLSIVACRGYVKGITFIHMLLFDATSYLYWEAKAMRFIKRNRS